MNNVTLGSTAIISDKNAFGALPIQRTAKQDAKRLLRRAYDAGFTFFDTARGYSDSEEKIGEALSDVRGGIHLASKSMARTASVYREHLDESLRMLKTDYIDVYQFHNPPFCPAPGGEDGLYEAALSAKRQGKIRHIGISSHSVVLAEQIIESGLYETLQYPLNYLSTERETALVDKCAQNNMGFIGMKALSGGLITDAAAAYAWYCQYDAALPIWGIQHERELDDFIAFFDNPPIMTPEILSTIEADRRELSGSFCRGCGYCMPTCPAGIQINMAARMTQLIHRSPSVRWLSADGQAMMKKVEDCTACGECLLHCPYGLDPQALIRLHYEQYKQILNGTLPA